MKRVLQVVVALPGILFLFLGLRWIIDPASAAGALGMTLLDGVGRSTQIGDLTAFFIVISLSIFAGLITAKRIWFYPPVMLLGFAAFFRMIAWLVHDAALAVPMIVPEILIAALLFFASAHICDKD
jgi:hypothetical protein